MAKKQAGKFGEGARVRVRPGVPSPEFPELSLAGWTGEVSETAGKKPAVQYVIEWDAATLAAMPPDYVARCEQQGLYHRMACLKEDDLEPA